jgi:hypothetical protein
MNFQLFICMIRAVGDSNRIGLARVVEMEVSGDGPIRYNFNGVSPKDRR